MCSASLLFIYLLTFATTNMASPTTKIDIEDGTTFPGKWTRIEPIPNHKRQEFSTVALNSSNIYVIGGITDKSPTGELFPTVTFTQTYSVLENKWASVASVPVAYNHPNVASVNGKIYLLGGLTPGDPITWVAGSACYVYDPVKDKWTSLGDMPNGRGSAAVGVRGNTIYLAGGLTFVTLDAVDREDTVDTVSSYDTVTNKWQKLPPLPKPRDHAAVALIDDTIYVLGGRAFGHDNVVNTVFALNVCNKTPAWNSNRAKMPTARGGCASAVLDGVVYTFGGEGDASNAAGVFDEVEAYEPKTDKWTKFAPMKVPRHGSYAAVVGRRIYLAGGGTVKGGAPTDYADYFSL